MNERECYIAENGTKITDELVDRWAREAEDGFPDAEVTPFEGRAWEMKTEPLKPRTIRLGHSVSAGDTFGATTE